MKDENPKQETPLNQIGSENPIHMQSSRSAVGFEPGSTKVKGK